MDESFEKSLEADIAQLAAEIRRNRERPELANAAEQDIVKEALRAFPKPEIARQSADVPSVPGNDPSAANTSPLPAYAENAPAEIKLEIEYLLDIALKKGLGPALAESEKSPAFVQDAFHDALAGKLYPELQRRGIVE